MEIEKKTSIALLLDFYSAMLTERQAELMQFYYGDDLSLAEVSDMTGITRQGVRDAIKKSENILLSCEQKLGLFAKYQAQADAIEQIVSGLRAATDREQIEVQIKKIQALLQ